MADTTKSEAPKDPAPKDPGPGRTPDASQAADVGTPTPNALRELAKDLPERDTVQKAYKGAMLADSAQEEARHKVTVVNESPDAAETPSGYALKKAAGVSNDAKRGEEYLRHKTARRWGYVPAE